MDPEFLDLFSRLERAVDAEAAAGALIEALADALRRSLDEHGLGDVSTLLRAAVHLRPDLGYRGLVLRTLQAEEDAPPDTSTTLWRALRDRRAGLCVDVRSRAFADASGLPWSPTQTAGSAASFAATRARLTARDTTHVVALPLLEPAGLIGMATLELRCADAVGDPRFAPWETAAPNLERLARLGALFLTRLPLARPVDLPAHSPLPVTGARSQAVIGTLARFARLDGPILLLGESGTGKTHIARWVHEQSGRAGPFVPADVAAMPVEQAAIRLFGAKRGAFTGVEAQRGAVARAERGTLFIDEVARLSREVQIQLFTLLDQGRYRLLGSSEDVQANVRIVAATNADLEAEVRAGRFHQDLLYRLESYAVEIPPLRERVDEIEGWSRHFLLEIHKKKAHNHHVGLGAPAALLLQRQRLAGNLRELQGVVERAWTNACLRVCPDVARWPTEVQVEVEDVERALEPSRARRGESALLEQLDACAAAFLREVERNRREGGAPIPLEDAAALEGAIVRGAIERLGDPAAVARLLGHEAQIRGGNHLKRYREAVERLDALAEKLGAPAPGLPASLAARRGSG